SPRIHSWDRIAMAGQMTNKSQIPKFKSQTNPNYQNSNDPNLRYGLKNISGWEAKSQRKKWNFQRCRKTLTTKTQRHEVLVKRLRMRMVISHWSLVISKEAKAEKRRKEAGRQEAGDSFDD
ncbi:MAG TPA: hypothetical protein PLI55_10500, partial [Candidatus Marinimicrobia bacterium]|nr:hypothetical protein [Candidatus Neomarinimicrobiota bacterium]